MGKTAGICVTAQLTHCTPVQSEATASRWSWLFSNKLLLTGSWTRQEVVTQYCEYTIEHWNVHFKMANLDCIITHLFCVCVWHSEVSRWLSGVGSFYLVSPRSQTEVTRLGSKHLYPPSHLSSPTITSSVACKCYHNKLLYNKNRARNSGPHF